jgi:quercetin dioxygenase-like cupin family protein
MEVIVMEIEYKPGETLLRHTHHREEAMYLMQGATLQTLDGKEVQLPTGTSIIFKRDVPHAGATVIGEKSLKMLNVFVVDKGKSLIEPVN